MKQSIILILGVVTIMLSGGCATGYKAIRPSEVDYNINNLDDGIGFSYRYDVLSESGNWRYAKHEKSRSIKVLAVRITNNTGQKINLSQDISFYTGNRIIYPLKPMVLKNELNQKAAIYLLYLFLTPLNFYTYTTDNGMYGSGTTSHSYPIGYVIGPGIAFGNMIVAGSANTNFYNELQVYSINRDLENGQTLYALVGFRDIGFDPITLKLKNHSMELNLN